MKNPALTELVRQPGLAKPTVKVLVDRLTEKGCVNRLPYVDG